MVDVVILTGLSGAGKTTAMKAFEDMGYYAIDNLPLTMLERAMNFFFEEGTEFTKLVLVIDSRTRGIEQGGSILAMIRERYNANIIFLDSKLETIQKRYKETRRAHPRGMIIDDALLEESQLMLPIKSVANQIIDTSDLNVHQLKELLYDMISNTNNNLVIIVQSFGFKYGMPTGSDLVFDVRFFQNPYFIPELKEHTGLEEGVQNYIKLDPDFDKFIDTIKDLLRLTIPRYQQEGKKLLNISVGCTGGKHRSVYITETISKFLKDTFDNKVITRHVDINKHS